MTAENCKHYETCSAPLCPLDKESLEDGVWYPDEEICCSRNHNQVDWVKRQRKIAKRANPEFYFTFKMLNRDCIIGKGMQGLNPDKTEEPQLKQWFNKHPVKSLAEKEKRAKRAKRLHKFRKAA